MEVKLKIIKNALLFFCLFTVGVLFAQKTVNGTVKDSDGVPLPGASIIEEGTNNGVSSDFEGNFAITLENENSKLMISYIGYKTQSYEIEGLSSIDALLELDSASLDEVLVIGYGSQKKSDLTGSVASVSAEEFETAIFNDISQVLQGRTSGVRVTNTTAAPGTAPQIRIRGNNSINGSNDPLWVVDGVPLTQAPIFSPNEIQSFEILKDASATAIYGARGANGVVIVTTKSGVEGRTSFEVYSNRSMSSPVERYDVISNRNDYINMVNEARLIQPGGAIPPLNSADYSSSVTDWQDEILQPGERTELGLNLSTGNETIRISAAANFLNDQGVIKDSGFKRGTLRLNTFFKASDWVSFDFKTSFSYSETENPNPLQGSRAGSTFSAAAGAPIILGQDYVGIGLDAFPFTSPLTTLENREFQTRTNNVLVSLNTTFNIIENLTFSNNTSVNLRSVNPRNYNRSAISLDQSSAFLAEFKRNDFVSSNYFTYTNDFDSRSDLTLTLGAETSWFNEIDFTSRGTDFPTDEFGPDNIGVADVQRVTSSRILSTLNSFFARANYVFDNKYLLNATFRADGSSRFATNNKWGYFPSFGAAYVLSNEDYFESESINNLKIRTSWGQVGSQAIAPYSSLITFGTEFRTLDSTAPNGLIQSGVGNQVNFGISPTRVNNDDLQWETTTSFNIGLDVGLFNNKVSFTADYYKKNTTDLLQTVIIPPQTGFSSALVNLGEIENGIKNLLNSFEPTKNQYWVGWVDLVGKRNNWYVEKSISKNSRFINHKNIQNEKSLKFGFSFIGRNNLNSMRIVNQIYFFSKKINFQKNKKFNDVFYPLGKISDTRNFAKKRKIVQVQFSLPVRNINKIQYLIDLLIDDQTPILCSVKRLTHNESNINFSFVQDGWTFAVDFPYETFNKKTIRKFYKELIKQEGKIYLAKDISLNEEEFKSMYPNYRDWSMVVKEVDPDKKFQSEMSLRLGLKKW